MPGNRGDPLRRDLGAHAERLGELALMRAIARERRFDRVLHRSGTAEPPVGHLLDRRQHVVHSIRFADDDPAGAPAGREVRLRERRERNDRRVGCERSEQRRGSVERDVAVDLVRQNRNARVLGERDQLPARRLGVHGARRVVRIDDHERARARRDQSRDVVHVRLPVRVPDRSGSTTARAPIFARTAV